MISAPRASATWRPSAQQLEQRRADPRAAVGVGHAVGERRRARVSTSGVSSARVTRVSRVPNVNASARSVERTTAWAKRSRSGLCARSEPETSIEQRARAAAAAAARARRAASTSPPVRFAAWSTRCRSSSRPRRARRARRPVTTGSVPASAAPQLGELVVALRRRCAGNVALVAQVDRARVQAGALARLERLELALLAGVRRRGLALVVVAAAPAATPRPAGARRGTTRRRRRRRSRSPRRARPA